MEWHLDFISLMDNINWIHKSGYTMLRQIKLFSEFLMEIYISLL